MIRHILFLIVMLATTLQLPAQSLRVTEFKEDLFDLSGASDRVLDLNGDPCALVKVGLAVPGATFEGDVVKTVYNDGEYLVYMVAGANSLTVKSDKFTPLRIDDNFGPLEGNKTYILNLENASQTQIARPDILPITLPAKGTGVSIGGMQKQGKSVKFNMILVKNGQVKMGATPEQHSTFDDEQPVHWARFSRPFYIGETEVTQELWNYVMDENPSSLQDDTEILPVENISWNMAKEFCTRLSAITGVNFRLPTEAEWEYAARGGHKAQKSTRYAGSDDIDEAGWYLDNSGARTHSVKSKQPNPLGLYDMSGNVWELCEDFKNDYPKGEVTDYVCRKENSKRPGRVRRGGAWDSEKTDELRVAYRRKIEQNERNRSTGMRLVLDL